MATNSGKTWFPEFFKDTDSPESVRRQFMEAPLEAAVLPAFGSALELAKLLSLLPDAFADSQWRELKRIEGSVEENDPRVAAFEASIEQAEALRTMARRGEVRAKRSLVAFASKSEIFHGFVSDTELNPLKGLTVQLRSGKELSKKLSTTTDADGYFSIPVGKRSFTKEESEKEAVNITPERIAELFASREKARSVEEQQVSNPSEGTRVEILKKGELLHEDPDPIDLGDGMVYREYIISDTDSLSESDFEKFLSSRYQPTGSASNDGDTEPAKASATRSAASRTARPGAQKKTSKGTKAIKKASKK
ncbi:MAG: carboxypeptidase regulatory-like domain-containing protein [Pyrinomonadaceae bacterium]|jgi:hypothetical protein|nr:carboxypeptidase regulatory-like domain-containing protein [Pyrinomonadaceae bacterium]